MTRGPIVRLLLPLTLAVLLGACVTPGETPPGVTQAPGPVPVQAAVAPAGPVPPGPKPAAPEGSALFARTP